MTSLKTLANHLGLSQATVSRALNNYSTVNKETREKVLAAARAMNYRPNASARRLATGKSGAYGMILATGSTLRLDPLFSEFMAGLTETLARHERDVLLGASFGESSAATYERFARTGKVDGFILSLPVLDDPRVAVLERLGLPFVVHGRTGLSTTHAYYDIDNYGAFRGATELLVQLGHRRIAFLNGQTNAMFAILRREGFIDGLAGLPAEHCPITETTMNEEQGYSCMRNALAHGVTAVLCSSVHLALGAERSIRDAGLQIGRDISLICHDDGPSGISTENFSAPLTVTRAPIRQAGETIAEMLEALSSGTPSDQLQTVAPVELILRGSTRPPCK